MLRTLGLFVLVFVASTQSGCRMGGCRSCIEEWSCPGGGCGDLYLGDWDASCSPCDCCGDWAGHQDRSSFPVTGRDARLGSNAPGESVMPVAKASRKHTPTVADGAFDDAPAPKSAAQHSKSGR